jgi:uncharacterized RDD family membrane protein YckC
MFLVRSPNQGATQMSNVEPPSHTSEATGVAHPAQFWPRTFAFAIDLALLAIVGLVIGNLFYDGLVATGPIALLIGFTISVLYFGFEDSGTGSLGKHLLGLQVVGKDGKTIGWLRAGVRAVILFLPSYLIGIDSSRSQLHLGT